MPAKRIVDIERALHWAFRSELPKRQRGGRFNPTHALVSPGPAFCDRAPDHLRTAPEPPGCGYVPDNRDDDDPPLPPAAGDTPHEDAEAIGVQVRALVDYAGTHFAGADEDPVGLLWGLEYVPADVAMAMAESTGNMVGLITGHARAGSRPNWMTWPRGRPSWPLPIPSPDCGANGKPRVVVDLAMYEVLGADGHPAFVPVTELEGEEAQTPVAWVDQVASPPRRKGSYQDGAYCPLVWRPGFRAVVAQRADYAAWRVGLDILAQALAGTLSSLAVLPPAAPWRPWAGECDVHGNVPELFAALRRMPHRRATRREEEAQREAGMRRERRARERKDVVVAGTGAAVLHKRRGGNVQELIDGSKHR